MKSSLYFCFPISGPNNGVKVISNYILTSLKGDLDLEVIKINTSQARAHNDFGHFSLTKIYNTLGLFRKVIKIRSTDYAYVNLTPKGFAFYRDLLILYVFLIKGVNATIHIHANGLHEKLNYINKCLLRNFKIIVINSDQFKSLDGQGFRLYLIPNSLPDTTSSTDNICNPSKLNNEIKLLFFSNLSKEKGIGRLKEIIEVLDSSKIKYQIEICGGVLDDYAKNVLNSPLFSRDHIRYYGVIYEDNDKNKFFKRNDFLLFLSDLNYEVYPLVYIEALMNSLPIITTKQVISHNFVRYNCGFEIENDMSQVLSIIIDNHNNIDSLKKNSRELYLRNYSFSNYIKQIRDIIYSI